VQHAQPVAVIGQGGVSHPAHGANPQPVVHRHRPAVQVKPADGQALFSIALHLGWKSHWRKSVPARGQTVKNQLWQRQRLGAVTGSKSGWADQFKHHLPVRRVGRQQVGGSQRLIVGSSGPFILVRAVGHPHNGKGQVVQLNGAARRKPLTGAGGLQQTFSHGCVECRHSKGIVCLGVQRPALQARPHQCRGRHGAGGRGVIMDGRRLFRCGLAQRLK